MARGSDWRHPQLTGEGPATKIGALVRASQRPHAALDPEPATVQVVDYLSSGPASGLRLRLGSTQLRSFVENFLSEITGCQDIAPSDERVEPPRKFLLTELLEDAIEVALTPRSARIPEVRVTACITVSGWCLALTCEEDLLPPLWSERWREFLKHPGSQLRLGLETGGLLRVELLVATCSPLAHMLGMPRNDAEVRRCGRSH